MFYNAFYYLVFFVEGANGEFTARVPNPAVHTDLLGKVHSWITAGATIDDVIDCRLYPLDTPSTLGQKVPT